MKYQKNLRYPWFYICLGYIGLETGEGIGQTGQILTKWYKSYLFNIQCFNKVISIAKCKSI